VFENDLYLYSFQLDHDFVIPPTVVRDLMIQTTMSTGATVTVPMHLRYDLVEEDGLLLLPDGGQELDAERHGHKTTVVFHGTPIVTVRPAAFKRCLANLVSNAARHADAIAITGHRDHRWLTVTVDDDGPGIPHNMREEVFKPFLRLDDARNQDEGGTGLGLAIARDIARSHGGDITLASHEGQGTTFTIRIPLAGHTTAHTPLAPAPS